jgi:hypothetical protein
LVLLPEGVQLRIPIQYSSRNELIKDADDKWREHGENNIVKGERPRLEGDLTGKVVEEGKLRKDKCYNSLKSTPAYPELCHVQHDIFIERIWRVLSLCVEGRAPKGLTKNENRQSSIAPGAVNKQEFLEVPELGDGDVRRTSGLKTLE